MIGLPCHSIYMFIHSTKNCLSVYQGPGSLLGVRYTYQKQFLFSWIFLSKGERLLITNKHANTYAMSVGDSILETKHGDEKEVRRAAWGQAARMR